jgi:3'-phosphoadenosine 5'-phosphosulfate sulfotransferase (PAPS reductase)/FAD synthetase
VTTPRPLIANYGGGVDSTAMLIEFARRGIVPDAIMFADTGSEKPETYAYVKDFADWLRGRGMGELTIVRRAKSRPSKTGPGYDTIEGNCLQNRTLPSLAFGRKACSLKWKADPMDSHLKRRAFVRDAWAQGIKPTKAIGYDCGPKDSRRAVGRAEDERFRYWYPLRDWGWDRERCEAEIAREGLPVPVKSACFFCPASKPEELLQLHANHPDLFARAIALEDNARPTLEKVEGLWRKSTKSKPGSWRAWAESLGLVEPLPEAE